VTTDVVTVPEPIVRATRYEVSCLPEDEWDAHLWDIAVEDRGGSRWAVTHHGKCLGRDGLWSCESIPSERRDEWLAEYRFDLDEALELAKRQAPIVKINGFTAADYLARQVFK
jgi:hypothetical protein